jgi:O-antigen/teichoic acid export membrane protein
MKSSRSNLRYDILYSTAATLSNAFYPWIVIITLSKYVGVEIVGIYAFATAIFTPIFKASALSLREITATNYTVESIIVSSFRIRLWTSLIALVFSLIILLGSFDNYWDLLLVLAVLRVGESLFDYSAGLYLRNNNYKMLAFSAIVRNVFFPLIMTLVIYKTANPFYGFLALLIFQNIFFLIFEFMIISNYSQAQGENVIKNIKWIMPPTRSEFVPYFKLSLPITSAIFIASVNASVPRIVSNTLFDSFSVGLLAGFVQISNAFVPFLNGVIHAAMPKLGKKYQHGDISGFNKLTLVLVVISLFCFVVIYGISVSNYSVVFLGFLLNETFAGYKDYFSLIAISTLFSYFNCVMGPVKIAQLQYKNELMQNIVVFLLLVSLCVGFGLKYGLIGIFYAIIISQAFRAAWLSITIIIGVRKKCTSN